MHFSNGTEKGTEGKRLRKRPFPKWTPVEYFDKTPSVPVATLGGDDTLFNVARSSGTGAGASATAGTGSGIGSADGADHGEVASVGAGDGSEASEHARGKNMRAGEEGGSFKGAWVPATVLSVDYDENLDPFYTIKVW